MPAPKFRQPSTAFGALSESDSFAEVDAGQVRYRLRKGDAAKPLVVFVHGANTPKECWDSAQEMLSTKGFGSLAYDLPGRGFSELTSKAQSLGFFEAHLHSLLQQVAPNAMGERSKKLILVGQSLGGAIAATFCAKHSGKVAGLLLVATAGMPVSLPSITKLLPVPGVGSCLINALINPLIKSGFAKNWVPENRKEGTPAAQDYDKWLNFLTTEVKLNPNLAPAMRSTITNVSSFGFVPASEIDRTMREVGSLNLKNALKLEQVSGLNDQTCPIESLRKLNREKLSECPNHVLNCGHFVMIEADRDFNTILAKFVGA